VFCGYDQLIAAAKGFEECVKLLLEQGADPNRAGTFGVAFDLTTV